MRKSEYEQEANVYGRYLKFVYDKQWRWEELYCDRCDEVHTKRKCKDMKHRSWKKHRKHQYKTIKEN